jgi:hypothetical protein
MPETIPEMTIIQTMPDWAPTNLLAFECIVSARDRGGLNLMRCMLVRVRACVRGQAGHMWVLFNYSLSLPIQVSTRALRPNYTIRGREQRALVSGGAAD